jgi:hypothetical protein
MVFIANQTDFISRLRRIPGAAHPLIERGGEIEECPIHLE